MKNTFTKIISLLLVAVMLCQLMPAGVFAAEKATEEPAEAAVREQEEEQTGSLYADVMFEETGLREESSKQFRMSDGSFIAVQYEASVHYSDDGVWKDIDNTLVFDETQNRYTARNADKTVSFAADLKDGSIYETGDGKYRVGLSLADEERSTAEAVITPEDELHEWNGDDAEFYQKIQPPTIDSEISYKNVFDGVDLKYDLHGFLVKESIVIHEPRDSYEFTFLLSLDGLEAVPDKETGEILLLDRDEVIYRMPAPYMLDADYRSSEDVSYDLEKTGDGCYLLTVTADKDWINSRDRVLPVSIDPTIEEEATAANQDIVGTYVRSGSPSSKQTDWSLLNIGYSSLNSEGYCYAYLNINTLPSIPKNCIITDARISLYNTRFDTDGEDEYSIRVYRVTTNKPSGYSSYSSWIRNLTYNTRPNTALYSQDYRYFNANNTYQNLSWDVVRLAQDWYKTKDIDANRAVMLTAENYSGHVVARLYAYDPSCPARFIVAYRNTVGLEDYMTRTSQSVDRAGTVSISDYTKQVTLVHPDVTVDLGNTSFTLSHVYNSANAAVQYTNSESEGIHTKTYNAMKFGKGWKLSAQETIVETPINSVTWLVYNDADGTEHYFYKSGSKWLDEDGLGLTVTKTIISGNNIYTMTDKDAYNTKEFYNGVLTVHTDSNGNKICYAYNNSYSRNNENWKPSGTDRQLIEIVYDSAVASESPITLATLSYNSSGELTSIASSGSNHVTSFSYTNERLTQITHPDSTTATYSYTSDGYMERVVDNESIYALEIAYDPNNLGGKTVSTVREYANNTMGSGYAVIVDSSQKMHYRLYGADRIAETNDDLLVYHLFDVWGRTTCSYTMDSSGSTLLGAESASFTQNSGTSGTNNRMTASAARGTYKENLLKDSGLEYQSSVWTSFGTGSSISGGGSTVPHLGNKMIAISGTGSTTGMKQTVTLTAGQDYTFSGYVNIRSLSGTGGVYLSFLNSSGTVMKTSCIDYITSEAVDNGWEKVSVTFCPSYTANYAVAFSIAYASGTVYGDDFQLENGDSASQTNLLQNGSFEDNTYVSGYWTANNSYCLRSSDYGWNSNYSMKITGYPWSTRWVYQNVNINQTGENKTFILSGWSLGASSAYPQYSDRKYGIQGIIYYSDGTNERKWIDFDYSTSTEWRYGSVVLVSSHPEKLITHIEVCMSYYYTMNPVYFDDLTLVMEPAQSYAYDTDGNLLSAADPQAKTEFEYFEDTSVLHTYTDLAGVSYTLSYDNGSGPGTAHNITGIESDGTTITNEYDAKGNLLSSNTTGSGTNKYLKSWTTYTNENQVSQQENVNGTGYRYNYNNTYHRMTSSAMYNGSNTLWQYYTYYNNSDRPYMTYLNNLVSLTSGYTNGKLTSLNRQSVTSGTNWVGQCYYLGRNDFGQLTGIYLYRYTKNADGTYNWSPSRTLATYLYANYDGHLTSMTYGNGDSISYAYDLFDRVTQQSYNDGDQTSYHYVYSAEDSLVQQYENHGSNRVRTYDFEYDSLGRLMRSKETDGSGNLIQRTQHSYDKANRLVSQSWLMGSKSYTESFDYDEDDGKLTNIIYNDGVNQIGSIDLSYDNLKRLSTESFGDSDSYPVFDRTYTYRDSVSTTGRTTLQVSELSYSGINGPTYEYDYEYNMLGDISEVFDHSTNTTTTYTYDNRRQLTGATIGSDTYSYTYDNAGNITKIKKGNTTVYSLSYGEPFGSNPSNWEPWVDLLTSYTYGGQEYTFEYDEIGNPTKYYHTNQPYFMTWVKGRQLSSIRSTQNSNPFVTYTYDMDGIRSSKTVNGTTTSFITQGGMVVRQTKGTQVIDFFYDSQQRPYALRINDGPLFYYILNLQGDVVAIMNPMGMIVAHYTYDPWGKVLQITNINGTVITDSTPNEIGAINPLRYRGYYYDIESGFYYLRSRYYDPNIGRFINADGVTNIGSNSEFASLNLYVYCGNNPTNRFDPDGSDWQTAFVIGIAVAIVGLVVLATIATGGGALALAGVGLSAAAAATATSAASATVAAGLTVAGGSLIYAAVSSNNPSTPNNYQKAKNNKTANEWAKSVGEKDAESLKEGIVGKSNVSKFNILKDKKTGELILERITTGVKVGTGYYLTTK